MRIEAYTQVQQVYQTSQKQSAQKTSKGNFSDQLQISSVGKDIQAAKTAVASASDVRSDVIAPIKTAVQNGTYDVSSDSFADKLLEKYEEMR